MGKKPLQYLILLCFLSGSHGLWATTAECRSLLEARALPDVDSTPHIFVGRVLRVEVTDETSSLDDGRLSYQHITGTVEVLEELRGSLPATVPLLIKVPIDRPAGSSVGTPPGIVHMGLPYVFHGNSKGVAIGECETPLRLHRAEGSSGDECRLQRFRKRLGISDSQNKFCEPGRTRSARNESFPGAKPLSKDEINELRWQELGIDWRAK